MSNRLITPPTEEPVTLAEAKLQCRVDHADEDELISLLISAAREQCEHILQRAIMPQTREEVLKCFPADEVITLRFTPLIDVVSVNYVDAAGDVTELNSANYQTDTASEYTAYLLPATNMSWPTTGESPNAVTINYTCGFANAAAVPKGIKLWILIAVSTLYKNRESLVTGTIVSKLPEQFFNGLIHRYKAWGI